MIIDQEGIDIDVFRTEDNCLKLRYDAEEPWIQPWSISNFRVRTYKAAQTPCKNWVLQVEAEDIVSQITVQEDCVWIKNGKIQVKVSQYRKLVFCNRGGEILLDEYLRNRLNVFAGYYGVLEMGAREFKPISGGDYHLSMYFVSDPREEIFEMG